MVAHEKRNPAQLFCAVPTQNDLALSSLLFSDHPTQKLEYPGKVRKKMVKSKIKVAVQKAGSTKPPSNSFFIEYEGGFGAPKIECAIVKLAFSLG